MRIFQTFYLKCVVVVAYTLMLRIDGQPVTCRTAECQHTATSILNSMKPTANPCNDFYEYACGNFPNWKRSEILPHMKRFSFTTILIERTFNRMRGLLEEPTRSTDSQMVKKIKQLYKSCLDTAEMDRVGVTPLIEATDSVGGWPTILDNVMYVRSQTPWEKIHYKYNRMVGEGSLLSVTVDNDPFDSSVRRIVLDQPRNMKNVFAIINDPRGSGHYKNLLKGLATRLLQAKRAAVDQNLIRNDIDNVIRFRHELKSISNNVRDENRTYNLMKIRDIQHWNTQIAREGAVQINWLDFFQQTFANTKGVSITDTTAVLVKELEYLRNLLKLIAHNSHRVVANHMHTYFVEKHGKFTGSTIRTLLQEFLMRVTGRGQAPKTWKSCILENQMRHVLSKMYVEKYFPSVSKTKLSDLTAFLKQTMRKQIERSPWVDSQTKPHALAKMDQLKIINGYEDWITNGPKLAAYYRSFEVGNNYFKNIISSRQAEYAKDLETLRAPRTIKSDTDYAFNVNAAYIPEYNTMEILAALMQWPNFGVGLPDAVTYAVTGSIVSHEMAHAYSNSGRMYDAGGRYANWWSPASYVELERRTECIKNQYRTFPVGLAQVWLLPDRTIDEDFADVLGLNVAFEAFIKKCDAPGHIITRLPGLENFTEIQLFFLAYANKLCEYINPQQMKNIIESDEHNLPRLRVNGPLMSLHAFSRVFNCPAGSVMNPQLKCHTWK